MLKAPRRIIGGAYSSLAFRDEYLGVGLLR